MLKGMVGIVTGGGSGLGRATVERFVTEGAKITLVDLPDSKGEEVAKPFGKEKCIFVPCDVTKEADVKNALKVPDIVPYCKNTLTSARDGKKIVKYLCLPLQSSQGSSIIFQNYLKTQTIGIKLAI